ncbi:MAG: hypothetical protein J7M39_04570 [Anaerolineae bacterium]|nr:hypothetical protein [Anaerolineae bacterium]
MLRLNSKKGFVAMAGVALTLALVGAGVFGAVGVVSAAKVTTADLETMIQASASPGLLDDGYLSYGDGWGLPGARGTIDYHALLAEALGISTDDLDAAHDTARTAATEQAVKEGLITRERADQMLVWGDRGMFGLRFRGMARMPRGVDTAVIDEHALLADALGITPEELTAAREQANEAAVAQAVEEGIITQEQAAAMQSRKDLAGYLDRNALLAGALNMTLDELEAAYADGETMSSLTAQKGLDAAAVRDGVMAAREAALAEAVADGVITQEQADKMSVDKMSVDQMGGFNAWRPRMPGRIGGRGRHRMPMDRGSFGRPGGCDDSTMPRRGSGFGDRGPTLPDNDDMSGTGFRFPGRAMLQGNSD